MKRDGNGVADTQNIFPLHTGGRAHQRTGSGEQQVLQLAGTHLLEQMPAQNSRTASAAASACMGILILEIGRAHV